MYRVLTLGMLAMLLICGCSGSESTPAQGANPGPPVVDAAAARATANLVVGSATQDVLADDVNPRQDALQGKNSEALAVVLKTAQVSIVITGEAGRVVNSPLGGSVDVVTNGNSITATFADFRTPTTTLNGVTALTLTSGTVPSGSYSGQVAFTSMRITTATGSYTLNGTAGISRNRSQLVTDTTWTANFTASEASGPTLTFQDFVTVVHADFGNGTATETCSGTLLYQNVAGLGTGSVLVSTPVPIRLANAQVVEGQLVLVGQTATVRLTVVAPNQVEIAVNGTVIDTVTWQSLAGREPKCRLSSNPSVDWVAA